SRPAPAPTSSTAPAPPWRGSSRAWSPRTPPSAGSRSRSRTAASASARASRPPWRSARWAARPPGRRSPPARRPPPPPPPPTSRTAGAHVAVAGPAGLAVGRYELRVVARDAFGNTRAVARTADDAGAFIVDREPPAVTGSIVAQPHPAARVDLSLADPHSGVGFDTSADDLWVQAEQPAGSGRCVDLFAGRRGAGAPPPRLPPRPPRRARARGGRARAALRHASGGRVRGGGAPGRPGGAGPRARSPRRCPAGRRRRRRAAPTAPGGGGRRRGPVP